MKKGYFYTMDAVIAVLILFIGLIVIAGMYFQSPDKDRTTAISNDITGVLSNIHLSNVCNDITACDCRYSSIVDVCNANLLSGKDMTLMELLGLLYHKNRFNMIEAIVNDTIIDTGALPVNYDLQLIILNPANSNPPRQIFPLNP